MENPTPKKIRVAIVDDHQSIIDGYIFRLSKVPQIEVVFTCMVGDDIFPALSNHEVDVMILDVNVPTALNNSNPYPILHIIPKSLDQFRKLSILVISMYFESSLIKAIMEAGAAGYILKDDQSTIRELGNIVVSIANGNVYFSPKAHQLLQKSVVKKAEILTQTQLQLLSIMVARPNLFTSEIADRLHISKTRAYYLMSTIFIRLQVHNKTAAIAKARELGLITPYEPQHFQE